MRSVMAYYDRLSEITRPLVKSSRVSKPDTSRKFKRVVYYDWRLANWSYLSYKCYGAYKEAKL